MRLQRHRQHGLGKIDVISQRYYYCSGRHGCIDSVKVKFIVLHKVIHIVTVTFFPQIIDNIVLLLFPISSQTSSSDATSQVAQG